MNQLVHILHELQCPKDHELQCPKEKTVNALYEVAAMGSVCATLAHLSLSLKKITVLFFLIY